mgnify:FL=1
MDNSEGNILSNQMGSTFNSLSPLLKQVHTGTQNIEGIIKIERGNALAHIICNTFGFPKARNSCTLKVECHHSATSMLWIRNFDGHIMKSSFFRNQNSMIEKLGPLDLFFSPTEKNGSLSYNFLSTKLFGIPLPKRLAPIIHAREYEENGEYKFEVKISMYLIGPILSYGGTMKLLNPTNQ